MRKLTKEERVKILLRSLPDAIEQQSGRAEGRGAFASRALCHGDLWAEGSYAELERMLVEMRRRSRRTWWHTTGYYAFRVPRARRGMADLGVQWLARGMGDVFVPRELTENAGFLASEARWAARPQERKAA